MSRHFKVHELLSGEELAELEAFASEPGRTVDETHDWLLSRCYTMARSSAAAWLASYRQQRMVERMTGGGQLAAALTEAARSSGGLAIPDAAVVQVGQMILESAGRMDEVTPEDLGNLALALQRLTLAKARLEDTRETFLARERQALEAATKVADGGGDGETVINTVREILGISAAPTAKGAA